MPPIAASEAVAYVAPYPILFVHGLDSDDRTWAPTLNVLTQAWPGVQTLHFSLNTSASTHWQADVRRAYVAAQLDGTANLFALNFSGRFEAAANTFYLYAKANLPGESESNASSITKQGYALGLAIADVLAATGAQKVVLVGHSMGGLAIREYLQRRESGAPKWWVRPHEPAGHRVAKVVTTGTPHLGSALGLFGPNKNEAIADERSDAVRDLRFAFESSASPAPFLYGGDERNVPAGFYSRDVNGDGDEDDVVVGLNAPGATWDHRAMPLPADLEYTWVVSSACGLTAQSLSGTLTCLLQGATAGDGTVELSRMFLYASEGGLLYTEPRGRSTLLSASRAHDAQTGDWQTLLTALDEPGPFQAGYVLPIRRPGDPREVLFVVQTKPAYLADGFDEDEFGIDPQRPMSVTVTLRKHPALALNPDVEVWAGGQLVARATAVFTGRDVASVSFAAAAVPHYVKVRLPVTQTTLNGFYALSVTSPEATTAEGPAAAPTVLRVEAWPSPATADMHVESRAPAGARVELALVDVLGRVVAERAFVSEDAPHRERFDVSTLAPGVYVLRARTGTATFTRSLVVAR